MAASSSSGHESSTSSASAANQGSDLHGQSISKTTPKDALVMASILKEMGVNEYEPRVINQMLEFTYRYVTDVLEDAKVYSSHASKKLIDLDDVKLAIERRLDHSFTSPPPRELLLEIARQKNSQPLPMIGDKSGLRLPPDRYCLTSNNYKMKMATGAAKKSYAQKTNWKETSQVSKGKSTDFSAAGVKPMVSPVLVPGGKGFNSTAQGALTPDGTTLSAMNHLQGGIKQEVTSDEMFSASQGVHPSSVSTISSLPSMEETTASVQQHQFPNLLKRKRDDEEEDYDT